jgi:CRP-like cAMP-binding protein
MNNNHHMNSFSSYFQNITDIPEDSLAALRSLFKPAVLQKDHYYARHGKKAMKLAFLEKGLMRVFYQNKEAEEFNKLFIKNPAITAAYASLITKEPAIIDIQCLTECNILEATFEDIVSLYDEHPSIERLNRKIAEDFFVEKEKREMSLVVNDATERYALFLKEFPGLENHITQYHIASYLGITPTQLSRIRAKKL